MWFFELEAFLLTVIVGVAAIVLAIATIDTRRNRRLAAFAAAVTCALASGVFAVSIGQTAVTLRDLDFHLGLSERIRLMQGRADTPDVRRLSNGAYFFVRTTGFSPDPYCGYEFAPFPDMLVLDPFGSGQGVAEPLGVDGWYWVCAS